MAIHTSVISVDRHCYIVTSADMSVSVVVVRDVVD
jgi:hypothetical protein